MPKLSSNETWSGLIAAVHTPFHSNGTLNLAVVERQAEHLAAVSVQGVFICGTTGECHSLTTDERRQLALRWSEVAPKAGLKWVVHVGSNILAEARALAQQAQDLGADAISALAPSYFKPPGVEELVEFCALVAEAAPQLPFFFYHIPGMTGVRHSAASVLREGNKRIANLVGLKFSHNDLVELQECIQQTNNSILFGIDEMLLAALVLGVRGAVGSTYNYAAPLYQKLMIAYSKGDLATARALQAQAVRMVRIQSPFDVMVSGKALMRDLGVDCGPVRLPLRNLTGDQYRRLRAELDQIAELRWS